MKLSTLMAEIPFLDWGGAEFLAFYLTALFVLTLWSASRARRALQRFDHPDHDAASVDPYEAAFLAAGPGRVVQLAVTRLLHQGFVLWKPGLLGARLQMQTAISPASLPAAEHALMSKISAAGEKGMRVGETASAVFPAMRGIEVGLASKGLRPTREERGSARVLSVMPLIALGLLGLVKVFTGLGRNEPVLILLAFLLATVIAIAITVRSVPRLTESGKRLLMKLSARNAVERAGATPGAGGLDVFSYSVALMGPVALIGMPMFTPIYGDLRKLHSKSAAARNSGRNGCGGGACGSGCGGGCSSSWGGSGCGGGNSGCGGSGCGGGGGGGGCGGGGD